MDSLLIQFRDNHTAHKDIHVWIEDYSCIADSYYLALDGAMLTDDESSDKVRQVLVRLLERWMEALVHATPIRSIYLPFDFSDEYTGCFRCTTDAEFIEIMPGWSRREGWSFYPSDPGDYFFDIADFKSNARLPTRLPRDEFLRRISDAIADAKSQLSNEHERPRG